MSLSKALFAASLCVGAVTADVRASPLTHGFTDEQGRALVFHGMNAVYKVAPWLPNVEGFDPENSLSDIDAANLKKWGFNIVRLGVMWPGVEPGARGDYNMTYLSDVSRIVTNLGEAGVYVILDLHQDIWHRKFCGEGVPDYVYESCIASEPSTTAAFPFPAVQETYPLDADGNPELTSCLEEMFATYYLSAEVGAGFQCLYDNRDNMWDAMAGFWGIVAKTFKNTPNVLGYELLNEPWAGDVYEDPRRLLPGVAEKSYLQPLYEHLNTAIRKEDDSKIVFFEGLTIDYWPNAFTAGTPGGVEYNDRQALAYHIYCPIQDPSVVKEEACKLIDAEFFAMRSKDADRIGSGMIMTEFGASENTRGDIYALEHTIQLADKHQQSWMYWQFKYYNDITTCTPEGEALYFPNGTVSEAKLTVLSRTYPMATAGVNSSYAFNSKTGDFSMNYVTGASFRSKSTDVYFNRDTHYPHGALVTLNGVEITDESVADGFTVSCSRDGSALPANAKTSIFDIHRGTSHMLVTYSGDSQLDDVAVAITVTKCGIASSVCTCRM